MFNLTEYNSIITPFSMLLFSKKEKINVENDKIMNCHSNNTTHIHYIIARFNYEQSIQ